MWPFKRSGISRHATRRDDVLWLRDAPRVDGVVAAAAKANAAGSHVLLVTHSADDVTALAAAAERAGVPLDGLADPATAAELAGRQLGGAGPCTVLTLAEILRPSPARVEAAAGGRVPVAVIVAGRHPLRTRDEAVAAFADALAASHVEFHVSLEDAVFRLFRNQQTEQVLRRLGMTETESIVHAMLTRSVRRAQEKIAARCPDHARVEAWMAEQLRA